MEQVGQGAQPGPLPLGRGRDLRLRPVRPIGGHQRSAVVWQDQQEVALAVSMRATQDLQCSAFKGMAAADNDD